MDSNIVFARFKGVYSDFVYAFLLKIKAAPYGQYGAVNGK